MKKILTYIFFLIILALVVIAVVLLTAKASPLTGDVPNDSALVQRGAYLAVAGDCVACHSTAKGQPFAGGLKMPIPMLGNIYSSNITPDPKTGIGNWTLAEFDRALRYGVGKDGKRLYPAMPYASYAKITDDDAKALYAYFKYGVPAVNQAIPKSTIPWPFSIRWPVQFWNVLFAPTKSYEVKSNQSPEWNRGAYLVQGLAHCGTCHTPRGLFMQEKAMDETGHDFLAGSILAGWEAPNITADTNAGVGGWTHPQLTQYLQTGNVPNIAQAGGPMGEAVEHSFSKLSDADIAAIATYIHSVPAVGDATTRPRYAWGIASKGDIALRGTALKVVSDPASIYLGACASCHQANGLGSLDHYYPSLVHNSTVGASNPNNLIQIILHGLQRKTNTQDDIGMPAFKNDLSDAEIASLTNYLTKQFGNPNAKQATEKDVKKLRSVE